jgi:hypothetical protein
VSQIHLFRNNIHLSIFFGVSMLFPRCLRPKGRKRDQLTIKKMEESIMRALDYGPVEG